MEAEASIRSRIRSRALGSPLTAIAPMFQITGRATSRLTVPMNSRRPALWAAAISAMTSGVT
jgi:hypothetical protein